MDGKLKGHAALWVANIIWGLNAPIGKSVLWSETHPQGVSPFALSVYRMLGACLLFWTVSLFLPREKVAPRDIVLLLFASVFGIQLNQMLFLWGLSLTSPIDSSIIATVVPVLTMVLATLFLPQVVLNIPQFLMYRQFGWVDSPYYLALIVPTLFAQETYFVYMLIQFMRNIPRELDEAAKIDGCNIMQTLVLVLVPMLWPAMVSAGLFQFMWSSNDFMGPLLYVNSPARYPATLFVRMSMDADTGFAWNRVMAVSLISIIPSLVVFFLAQRQFMDGVTAGAVKG